MQVNRSLIAEPFPPTGVWIYQAEEDGGLIGDCGRCGAWWYMQDSDDLEQALTCVECVRMNIKPVETKPRAPVTFACTHCSTPEDCAVGYSDCPHRKVIRG